MSQLNRNQRLNNKKKLIADSFEIGLTRGSIRIMDKSATNSNKCQINGISGNISEIKYLTDGDKK